MHVEQHGWPSPRVNRWMGLRVYGHYGSPILVFPTSGGDEREYEGQGMLDALGHHVEAGKVKLFCVNSVNHESWYLHHLGQDDIRLVTGPGPFEDPGPTCRFSDLLESRGIGHSLDDWGPDGGHDWPYWKRQTNEYIGRLY